MKRLFQILAIVTLLPGVTDSALAEGGKQVRFKATEVAPTPFKVKRAKAQGIELKPTPGIDLDGWLFEPEEDGVFPGVVILVSGDGMQQSHLDWGRSLAKSGLVTLVIDSFGSRGTVDLRDSGPMNMVDDAVSGHRFLSGLGNVDADRLGLLGFSMGGRYVFNFMDATRPDYSKGRRFTAAVAVYPACSSVAQLSGAMLILIGDGDKHASLAACQEAVARSGRRDHPMKLHVYPGATHFFDNPNYDKTGNRPVPSAPEPIWFDSQTYDNAAHLDAVKRVTGFLAGQLQN